MQSRSPVLTERHAQRGVFGPSAATKSAALRRGAALFLRHGRIDGTYMTLSSSSSSRSVFSLFYSYSSLLLVWFIDCSWPPKVMI